MDMQTMDERMLHAQQNVIKALTKFFLEFYASRIPSAEEMSAMFGIPPEDIAQVMYMMGNESEVDNA